VYIGSCIRDSVSVKEGSLWTFYMLLIYVCTMAHIVVIRNGYNTIVVCLNYLSTCIVDNFLFIKEGLLSTFNMLLINISPMAHAVVIRNGGYGTIAVCLTDLTNCPHTLLITFNDYIAHAHTEAELLRGMFTQLSPLNYMRCIFDSRQHVIKSSVCM
jgi:hypothetical protein